MKLPGIARVAFSVAVAVAGLLWLASVENPVMGVPVALLFTIAAIGLWRGNAWCGLGAGIVVLVLVGFSIPDLRNSPVPLAQAAMGLAMCVAAAVLLIAGGWSLRGKRKVHAWPWLAVAAGFVVFLSCFRMMVVPTGAMEDTVLAGDRLLMRRVLVKNPGRGDLVVHRYPVDPRSVFLKRVVGLPGDRIHFEDKRLFVNGVEVEEPYVKHATPYVDPYRDQFPRNEPNIRLFPAGLAMLRGSVREGELIVPEGKFFVLGDNRDNSLDSRYWGFIDNSLIVGRPVMVMFSSEMGKGEEGRWPLLTARWERTFKRL